MEDMPQTGLQLFICVNAKPGQLGQGLVDLPPVASIFFMVGGLEFVTLLSE
jgi:hypothetical protein